MIILSARVASPCTSADISIITLKGRIANSQARGQGFTCVVPSVRQSDPFAFVYLRGKCCFFRINAIPDSGLISSLTDFRGGGPSRGSMVSWSVFFLFGTIIKNR